MSTVPSLPASAPDPAKLTLAAEAWRPLIDFVAATGPRRSRVFAELGLTPNDGRTLASLNRTAGRSMRALATEWGCDASTATWAVDRLVAKGLAERRPHDRDRRVTLVALTDSGAGLRRQIRERVHEPPPELLELGADELIALRDAASVLPVRDEG
jgi:DNA-binding MarR family transcriptional regulator